MFFSSILNATAFPVLILQVRSKTVGHFRDVRRLVVACSRARLGLYIFGRKDLYGNCIELSPAFDVLNKRPNKLQLVLGETARTSRKVEDTGKMFEVQSLDHMKAIVGQRLSEEAVIRQTGQRIAEQAQKVGTEAGEVKVDGMEIETEVAVGAVAAQGEDDAEAGAEAEAETSENNE